jgi:hypothetical protein
VTTLISTSPPAVIRAAATPNATTPASRSVTASAAAATTAQEEQAIENTRELAESWIERARANGQDIARAELAIDAMHEPLFASGGGRR